MLDQTEHTAVSDLRDQAEAAGSVAAMWSAEDDRLAHSLLSALVGMAIRSKRRQADLGASIRASGLRVGRERILAALDTLHRDGFVDQIVPLSDGGILLSVTASGVERLNPAMSWDVVQPA